MLAAPVVAPGVHLVLGPLAVGVVVGIATLWCAVYVKVGTHYDSKRRVLLVGGGPLTNVLFHLAGLANKSNVTIVGMLNEEIGWDDETRLAGTDSASGALTPTGSQEPMVIGCQGLSDFVAAYGVNEIVLANPGNPPKKCLAQLTRCYESGIRVSTMPQLYEELSGRVPVEQFDATWLGAFPLAPAGGRVYATAKRFFDILASVMVLIVTAPLLALVALAVRISSPGPVLFRQLRVGLNGEHFYLLKFRTMSADAGRWGARVGDTFDRAKITPVGKWLRRLYLDELPQLFLVLTGHMSLVGPRPMRAEPAVELEETVPLWRAKYSVRPGVTGLGQIGFGYAWDANDEMERLKYDLYYVRHRSLALDTRIILRTVIRVVKLSGN